MKKKFLFVLPALFSMITSHSLAQVIHPDLKIAASKVDLSAESIQLNKYSGDIGALTQYMELFFNIVKESDHNVPAGLNVKGMVDVLALDKLRAGSSSSAKVDNAWLNYSYIDTGGSEEGIFSLLGRKNQPQVVPTICPVGTDIAVQLELDLRKVEQMIYGIAEMTGDTEKIDATFGEVPPELEMTFSEALAKMNVRVNLMLDLDANDEIPLPIGNIGRPLMAARVDGISWLWPIMEKQLVENPLVELHEKDGLLILKPTNEGVLEMKKSRVGSLFQIIKLSPLVVIDLEKDAVWVCSNEDYLAKCLSGENTLANSPAYKQAMEKLPKTANSMVYVSEDLLKKLSEVYMKLRDTGLMGEKFKKAEPLMSRFLEDLTESDKGWIMSVAKDETGILTASRGPFATKHLKYLVSAIGPMIGGYQSQQHKVLAEAELKDAAIEE